MQPSTLPTTTIPMGVGGEKFRLPNLFARYNLPSNPLAQPTIPSFTGQQIPPTDLDQSPIYTAAANNPVVNGASGGSGAGSDSTSAATAAEAEAERKRLSNVDRFWAEEHARKGKPRIHLGVGGASKAKKKQAYFQAPADPNHAKVMWEKMKMELDHKWEKFQGAEPNTQTQGEKGSSNQKPAVQPQQQQQQQPQYRREEKEDGGFTARESSSKHTAFTGSHVSGSTRPTHTNSPSTSSFRHGDDPTRDAATIAAARRSSAYAFTNLRKDDLKPTTTQSAADATPRYGSGTTVGRDSTHIHINKPQQPYSYQPRPPTNPPPTNSTNTTSKSSSNPPTGAQFSSFTRPPQPHQTNSHTTSASGGTTYYFTQQSQAAAAAAAATGATHHQQQAHQPPPSSTSSSYSSSNQPSSSHGSNVPPGSSSSHRALYDMFSRWSVKELKRELVTYGVSALEIVRLVEKDEFITRCVRVHLEAERKAEIKRQAEQKEAAKENLKDAIIDEVDRWAKGRNIKSMLNELNGCLTMETVGYLKRSDGLKEVSKSYKRALLRIHPDKHMDNESKHLRATEVFKYVSQAFNEYKKKFDK